MLEYEKVTLRPPRENHGETFAHVFDRWMDRD